MNVREYRGQSGFTLIEMLVVIVIMGILAAVVAPRFFGKTEQSRIAAAQAQIESFCMAIDSYQLDNGFFPTTEQGLNALLEKPGKPPEPRNWRGPYLRKRELPSDPWGNQYIYACPGKNSPDYDLFSHGKDGTGGGTGDDADITNW